MAVIDKSTRVIEGSAPLSGPGIEGGNEERAQEGGLLKSVVDTGDPQRDDWPSASHNHHTHPVFLQPAGLSYLSLRQETNVVLGTQPASPRPCVSPLGHKGLNEAYLGGWAEVVVGFGRMGR